MEEEDEEKQQHHLREGTGGSSSSRSSRSTLQVAVLLQMPSPSHAEAQNDIRKEELLGELAIGLIEVPWPTS